MNLKISRRDLLRLSLEAVLSACTAKSSRQSTPTITVPKPTATIDTSPYIYDADDPNILYSGRIDFSDPKQPKF